MIFAGNFIDSLPDYDKTCKRDEIAPYKLAANDLALLNTPLRFWFANKECFSNVSELTLRHFCIPRNSVEAERSVSMYTQVNAPQRQGLSDDNIVKAVMFAYNLKQDSWLLTYLVATILIIVNTLTL